jgi:hypothetical protein
LWCWQLIQGWQLLVQEEVQEYFQSPIHYRVQLELLNHYQIQNRAWGQILNPVMYQTQILALDQASALILTLA